MINMLMVNLSISQFTGKRYLFIKFGNTLIEMDSFNKLKNFEMF